MQAIRLITDRVDMVEHEERLKDIPQLDTIQGLTLLLKAYEAVPKRGYFYRSWRTIQDLISMCKDLGIHKHLEDHKQGRGCPTNSKECAIKHRLWGTLFELELMIGGPQGTYFTR